MRMKDDAIAKYLDKFCIYNRCVDVDTMVEMYKRFILNCCQTCSTK